MIFSIWRISFLPGFELIGEEQIAVQKSLKKEEFFAHGFDDMRKNIMFGNLNLNSEYFKSKHCLAVSSVQQD